MLLVIIGVVIVALIVVLVGFTKNVITRPEFRIEPELTDTEWRKTAIIKITKDSNSKYKLVGYRYCINDSKSTVDCDWKISLTKNIEVYQDGINYVHIKALDEKDREGNEAIAIVKIDSDSPNVSSFKVIEKNNGEIKVNVEAKDALTNIKYFYSTDGQSYVEGNKEYVYTGLEVGKKYTLYTKVVDEAGNAKTVAMEETAK